MKNVKSLKEKPFYRLIIPESVMILALTDNKKIILVRQYRQSVQSFTLELPCGQIDPGESPKQAVTRELFEETGYVCKRLNYFGRGLGWIDRSSSGVHLFYGQGAVKKEGYKYNKNMRAVPVSKKEFRRLVLNGDFRQMQGFALLYLAKWKFGLEI